MTVRLNVVRRVDNRSVWISSGCRRLLDQSHRLYASIEPSLGRRTSLRVPRHGRLAQPPPSSGEQQPLGWRLLSRESPTRAVLRHKVEVERCAGLGGIRTSGLQVASFVERWIPHIAPPTGCAFSNRAASAWLVPLAGQTTVWGQVLGTGAGILESRRNVSRTSSKRAAKPHRARKDKTERLLQPAAEHPSLHGKEGVDGSSPSEGSAKTPHVGTFAFSPTCRVGSVRWVWSRLWSFRVQNGVARGRQRIRKSHEPGRLSRKFAPQRDLEAQIV